MASTVADVIASSQRHLLGMHRGLMDRLGGGGINSVVTDVTVEFGGSGISEGSYLGIDDELMYVWVWDTAQKKATVQRGMFGTTPAAHAVGALIEVDPRFFRAAIRDEIGKEINSWYPRLFRATTVSLPVLSSSRAVDTSSLDILHILDVTRDAPVGGTTKGVRYRWDRGIESLILEDYTEGTNLSVTYATTFDTSSLADGVDLVATAGLTDDMIDIIPTGVAWRLLVTREIGRTETDSQAEPRDAQEVPPGHIIQTGRELKRMRDERIAESARLLQHRWGVRVSA